MRLHSRLAAGAVLLAAAFSINTQAAQCDPLAGKKSFATCQTCHSADDSGAHLVGPNLYGVVGRDAGAAPGFFYSPAFEELERRWTEQELTMFLQDPMGTVPGTFMAFGGIKDAQQRQDLICYLKQLN